MKRTVQQMLAIALSVLLLLSLLPVGVLAAQTDTGRLLYAGNTQEPPVNVGEPVPTLAAEGTTYLYCQAPEDWTKCYVYWWYGDGQGLTWPGVPMGVDANGIWFFNVPDSAAGVLFHNNTGTQSRDLALPTGDELMYVFQDDYWTTYGKVKVEERYYVAGVSGLCGVDWVPDAPENKMTKGDDGTYSITYTGVAAGCYDFKVTNGSWSTSWGEAGTDCNYVVTVDEDNSTVVISFDPATKLISSAINPDGYLVSEDTVVIPGWPLAPDEICVQFVSVSDGIATLSLIQADPHYRVVVYEDRLWLTSYSGTQTPDTKQFPVREGSEYSVYLSAVCYSNSNLDTWDYGGTLTYKLTSSAPVRDVIQLPPEDPKQIVDDAYALEEGLSLPYQATLTGQIVAVNTPWSEQYQNITVTMLVEGKEIKCYRLAGEGAKELTPDDTITVTGTLTNYYGTIEFEQGCILIAVEKGDYEVPIPPEDPRLIVDEAYALAPGAALPYEATLTGRIIEVLFRYNEEYRDITVRIVIAEREDKPIVCYRVRGDWAERLVQGDIITVTGVLKNYNGTIEFDPCTLLAIGGTPGPAPDDWGPDSLALVGSGIPGVTMWDPADPAGDMTEVSDNVYEKIIDCPAGTSMSFKIAGNDMWVDEWNFGCADPEMSLQLPLNQKIPLASGGDTADMRIVFDEACTVRFTVDLNPMYDGGFATLLIETDVVPVPPPPVGVRPVGIDAPTFWSVCYVYAWGPDGTTLTDSWPGTQLYRDTSGLWLGTVPVIAENVIFHNGMGSQTDDLVIPNEEQWVYLYDEDRWVTYGAAVGNGGDGPDSLALVGSGIPGLAEWDPADPAGHMTEVSDNVYEKTVAFPAGTAIEFKLVGNDVWDDQWVFGCEDPELSVQIPLNQAFPLGQGGGSWNLQLFMDEACTVRFIVDLNPLLAGGEAVLLLETDTPPPPVTTRKLTVVAPASWTNVYAYTWDPEEFGTYPGSAIQMVDGVYQTTIRNSMVSLVLSTLTPEGGIRKTDDIALATNGKDVFITIAEDCTYSIRYGDAGEDVFRVVGNADWMGNWYSDSDAGRMAPIGPGVYQKCFENVAPGHYEFRITKNGTWDESWGFGAGNYEIHVFQTCDVTVTFTYRNGIGSAQVEYETVLMGDVTGDGKLNMGDVSKVFAHVRGTIPITDAGVLACADYNGDGRVNVGDVAAIYAYVRDAGPMMIVDQAYALDENEEMSRDHTLTGMVIDIIEPYNDRYDCITVSMVVEGRENYPIICSRLMGEHVRDIGVDDIITVTGRLRNFYGSVEFKECCRLVKWVDVPNYEEYLAQLVDEAYALGVNESMDYGVTLQGRVVSVDQPYSGLPYICVTIAVEGREDKPIYCYRLMGDAISEVWLDDTIAVTGTLRNFNGQVEFGAGCLLEYRIPGNPGFVIETDPLKIVDLAYALGENEEMAYDVTLTGKVRKVKEAYNSQYQNISVYIQVAGREYKPILCYHLKGDGVANVAEGDTITVVGRLKNFYGDIEMVNCTMTGRTSGGGTVIKPETDPAKILAAAAKLKDNEELPYTVTLTGKVQSIDDVYSEQYQNITVTIAVNGTSSVLKLYRLKGDGVNKIAVGDTLTVEGKIKMFYDELELVNCTMTNWVSGGGSAPVVQTDYKKIVDDAYALAEGAQLGYEVTLEGRITALNAPFDAQYQNMTVTIEVPGREGKPIECYRMKGDGIGNHLCVGDTITVTGKIRNYNGSIEFDIGCQMVSRTSCGISKPSDPKQIVDAAFALAENASLPYFATLTGTVKTIDQAYSDQYKNVTVTITVQGTSGAKDIQCYRMKGDLAANVTVGSTITVTGAIKRFVRDKDGVHEDFVEFDSGCILESLQR